MTQRAFFRPGELGIPWLDTPPRHGVMSIGGAVDYRDYTAEVYVNAGHISFDVSPTATLATIFASAVAAVIANQPSGFNLTANDVIMYGLV